MKNKTAKLISVLLAAIMCFSFLPLTAFAVSYPQGVTQADAAAALPKAEKLVESLIKQNGGTAEIKKNIYASFFADDTINAIFKGVYSSLSENESMRKEIRKALKKGLPCMAECGGFMYLHQAMEDMEGVSWPMAGVIDGKAFRTEHLVRFGYVLLEETQEKEYGVIPAHEFHYFDSTANGTDFLARKASGKRSWECMHKEKGLLAGFPHLYYFGNPKVPRRFLMQCEAYKKEREETE